MEDKAEKIIIMPTGELGLIRTKCVICEESYLGGGQITCSDACHEELVNRLVAKYGEFKKVISMRTRKAYKVPTRDIIEKGLLEQELNKYPLWAEGVTYVQGTELG